MSAEENKEVKATEKASEVARKIWLAGLGAYGKAFDGASEQYDKYSKETSKFFEELVSKGKVLDSQGQEKLSEAKAKIPTSIEERIAKVRSSLFGAFESNSELSELSEKVDLLSDKVDALIELVGGEVKKDPSKIDLKKTSKLRQPNKVEVA